MISMPRTLTHGRAYLIDWEGWGRNGKFTEIKLSAGERVQGEGLWKLLK